MSHTRKLICILLSGSALGAAAPAFADQGYGHGYRHHRHGGPVYYGPRVVYAPAPVYYAQPSYVQPSAGIHIMLPNIYIPIR